MILLILLAVAVIAMFIGLLLSTESKEVLRCQKGFARVTGPFYSITASGTVAKALTAGKWKGIAWMRTWFRPQNPQTTLQTYIRDIFSMGVDAWHFTLSAGQKTGWETGSLAKGKAMSGFNYHESEYILAMVAGTTPPTTSPL